MIKKTSELILRLFRYEFVRFLFTGAINSVFGYGVFFLFRFLTRSDALALLAANVLGIVFNFNTISRLVFKDHRISLIFRFILVYAVLYGLNLLLLKLLTWLGLSSFIGQAILVIPIAMLSYVLNKMIVFRNDAEKE